MLLEPPSPFVPGAFRCQPPTLPWQLDGYRRLRREVFCDEQRLFDGDDTDEHDATAIPIVALSIVMGMADTVVGAVRVDERAGGLWHGSRLAVHRDFRGVAGVGASLVRKAVSGARSLGCRRFLATVQEQNVPFFRRLHWRTLEVMPLHGMRHHLMEAELAFYPPVSLHTPIELAPAQRRAS